MWDEIKSLVGKSAPLLGTALLGPGTGTAVGAMIASVLGVDNDPEQILEKLKTDPDALVKLKQLEYQNEQKLQALVLESETKQLAEVNKTIRAELTSDNFFKSGWRPFIGWIVGLNIGLLLFSLAYSILTEPKGAADVVASATVIITMALGVLGYNVKQRTNDKETLLGKKTPGIMESVAMRIRRDKNAT